MNNPYAQPPRQSPMLSARSPEECLRQMLRQHNHDPPSVATVRPILDRILVQPSIIKWTEDLVKDLSIFTLVVLASLLASHPGGQPVSEGSLVTFALLTTAMEEWDDNLVYSALLQEYEGPKETKTLLEVMADLVVGDHIAVHRIALVGLSTAYRSMDRLHRYLTLDPYQPDRSWWLESLNQETLSKLTSICAEVLLSSNSDASSQKTDSHIPSTDQIQLAATSFLCTVLKQDQLSALEELDEQDLRALCQNLLRHIQTLINPQLPHTYSRWYISCALVSVSLLPLIRWRHDIDLSDFDRIIHSTTLVETISTFAFPTGQDNNASHDTPEWIHDQNNEGPRAHVFDTIHSWALAGNMEWSVFLKHENLWRKAIKEFWTDSFAQKTQHTSDNITGIGLLHHSSRLIARGALSSALQCHSSNGDKDVNGRYTNLLDSLFGLFGDTHSSVQLQAVCLVRTLLSDRKRLGTHDEISRSLWACIDDKIVQRVFHMLIRFPQTESSTRPLLLAIVDLFDTLLQDQQNCDVALKCLNSESLERMINLVVPKNVKFDYKDSAGWDDLSLDIASETPPANNLSRMDENSICIEKEDEGILRGVDTTIQLSFATVLARLAFNYSAINEEGIHLLKSRACTVVKDFVAQCLSHSIASASFDTSKRSFRLQLVVATSENEDFVSTTLYSAHVLNQKQYAHLKLERESAQQKLQDANRRSQDLEGQVTKLTNQNRSKSIVFKREMNRIKENTCQNAEQLVAIHARERSSVESRLGECRQQLEEARAHLETALRQADESQRMVNSTKDELQRTLIRTVDLEKENQNILRQIEQERTRARELEEEVQSKNQKLDTLFRKNEALEDDIQERDRTINECEAANENLRDNLEELFADMVSMATIYEAKEDEVVKLQRQHHVDIEKTESKLRRELERNGELTSTVDQLRLENDKLYRKLAKYKERLEDERRERQDEATRRKRNGPVSYMNQLHQSNSSDKNVRDRSSTRNDSRSNKSQLRAEKENNHWYSDSQRRKNS